MNSSPALASSRILLPYYTEYLLLRRILSLYYLNPVDDDFMTSFTLMAQEKSNVRLYEQIWFLVFLGAPTTKIDIAISLFRNSTPILPAATYLNSQRTAPAVPVPEPNSSVSQQHPRKGVWSQVQSTARNPSFQQDAPAPSEQHRIARHSELIQQPAQMRDSNAPASHYEPHGTQRFQREKANKSYHVHSHSKGNKFSGAPEQSIELLIRDYEVVAEHQSLTNSEISLFFVNALADPARSFFLNHYNQNMQYSEITSHMRRHYNSKARKLAIQSEIDGREIESYMKSTT